MNGSGRDGAAEPAVSPAAYTREYFLSEVEGHADFAATGGRDVGPRFARALALAQVTPGERVLDVGCGRGEILVQAALAGSTGIGIDYAPVAVALAAGALRAARAAPPGGVALASGLRLPFQAASFDAVFLLDVVEHLSPRELPEALRQAARVLRPGGRLVVHTSPNRLFTDIAWPRWVAPVHRTLAALSRLLQVHNCVLNPLLPVDPHFAFGEHDDVLHVGALTPDGLAAAVRRAGLRVRGLDFQEPRTPPGYNQRVTVEMSLLDFLRFGRPFTWLPPFDRFFSNHIWLLATR